MQSNNRFAKRYYWKFFVALLALMLLPTILMFILRLDEHQVIVVKQIQANSFSDILEFQDTLIVPTLYQNLDVLDSLEGTMLKKTFVEIMLPAVLIAKYNIEGDRKKLEKLVNKNKWSKNDSLLFKGLSNEYKTKNIAELMKKMSTHPNSIVLAQAAIESGWGRSRFCKEANNVFGIWSYNEDEPRIEASQSREGNSIFLRKYDNLSKSIEDYFRVISKARAYENFRTANANKKDPYELVNYLTHYSERRWAYVNQLKQVMRQNDFTQYDRYKIHPEYIKTKRTLQ